MYKQRLRLLALLVVDSGVQLVCGKLLLPPVVRVLSVWSLDAARELIIHNDTST